MVYRLVLIFGACFLLSCVEISSFALLESSWSSSCCTRHSSIQERSLFLSVTPEAGQRKEVVCFMSSSNNDEPLQPNVAAAVGEGNIQEDNVPKMEVKCPNCNMCDGSGRIIGGLGAVLPWIPIKAYRPCPNFIERGGKYKRTGQRFNEIAFGGRENKD